MASLANCSTLFGDVIIGHFDWLRDIDISGPAHINGNLIMENNQAPGLYSTSLTSITGTLALTNNKVLFNLTMPALTRVGSIHFQSSPLDKLDLGSGITSVGSVFIEDSWMKSFDILDVTSIDNLTLTNNIYLDQVSLPVRDITSAFMIETK